MQLAPHLVVDEEQHSYYPVVYFNEFWLLKEQLVPLNETVTELSLQLSLHDLASWKFMLYNQMEESFNMQVSIYLACQGSARHAWLDVASGNEHMTAWLYYNDQQLHDLAFLKVCCTTRWRICILKTGTWIGILHAP